MGATRLFGYSCLTAVEARKKKVAGSLARRLGASDTGALVCYAAISAREGARRAEPASARGARTLMVQGACSGSILAGR